MRSFVFEIGLSFLGIKLPAAFAYTSSRMLLAAMTSLLWMIIIGPSFIRWLQRLNIGQHIRKGECPPLGELHAKKQATPTMGGGLILSAILVSSILWLNWRDVYTWILVLSLCGFGVIGAVDDWYKLRSKSSKGLSGKAKLIGQVAIALFISLYLLVPSVTEFVENTLHFAPPLIKDEVGNVSSKLSLQSFSERIYVPFFKHPLVTLPGILAALFFCVVIVGSSNGVNLTDGLDGLAAGCLVMVAFALSIFAFASNHLALSHYLNVVYIEGSGEIAVFFSALCGATLGFLWFNGHPAEVFMGDTGSLALGGAIGVGAVLLKREVLLALIGGVFVAEALSVILQVAVFKFAKQRRVFLCAPLHHHFEYLGWHEVKVVIRFWIIAFLLTLIGLASLKFQ